jgi:hypothetical protein
VENTNPKKEKCELCEVSTETISTLKKGGREEYLAKKQERQDASFRKMRNRKIKKIAIFSLLFVLLLGGSVFAVINYSPQETQPTLEKPKITVFYSPTCSCCSEYISYLKRNGFEVLTETDASKRMDILEKYQVTDQMTSCHTSIVGDYFIEGHMPVEVVKKLLEEKPDIDGIALPGMPQGSPGMGGLKAGKWTIHGMSEGVPSEFMVY